LENAIKEDILFYMSIDGRAVSLEMFNIINNFLEDNEIKEENTLDCALPEPSQCPEEVQDFRHR
jgi:hypothetical protein